MILDFKLNMPKNFRQRRTTSTSSEEETVDKIDESSGSDQKVDIKLVILFFVYLVLKRIFKLIKNILENNFTFYFIYKSI